MRSVYRLWSVALASLVPMLGAINVFGQEEKEQVTRTMTVVVNSDDLNHQIALDQISKQLKKSGLAEEEQKKLLSQIEELLGQATATAKKATAIVVHSEDSEADGDNQQMEKILKRLPRSQISMDDLRNRVMERIQGRLLQGTTSVGPTYRIGISLLQKQDDVGDDDEGDDDEGDDEDDDEVKDEDGKSMDGLIVDDIMDDSPASKAGIQPGDVIVSVNGETLTGFAELQEAVQVAGKADKPVVLAVRRDDNEIKIKVKPVQTDASDIAMMELDLIPQDGVAVAGPAFVFRGEPNVAQGQTAGKGFAWSMEGSDESIKKEIAELRDEIAGLKKMIEKLLDK